MRFRLIAGIACSVLATTALTTIPAAAHPTPDATTLVSANATQSTTGDYASDVLGDAWDFNNAEDIPAVPGVGCVGPTLRDCAIDVSGGRVTFSGAHGAVLRLVMDWGMTLPWGRDGRLHPIDAATYSQFTVSNCAASSMAVTFTNDAGEHGTGYLEIGGCTGSPTLDMRQFPQWRGKIVELNLHSSPGATESFDWIRLRRPDAPAAAPGGVPVAKVLTPNADGGADYGSSIGNTWDMTDPGDIAGLLGINGHTEQNGLVGTTTNNDPGVIFPLPVAFNPDRYHRFSADLCVLGQMGLEDAPGGGMNARIIWSPDLVTYTETQDIVVYPGCHHIAIELATDPAVAVNDEASVAKMGWRGHPVSYLRFDPVEDPGPRTFSLKNVKFADDAAFATSYPITFQDTSGNGGTADIYASTTSQGASDGVRIASQVSVAAGGGVSTFTWNGTDANGSVLGNGSYWISTVIRNGRGVATGVSDAPVRIERPVSQAPATFVPLSPSRLLDTRDGTGGNIVPLGPDVQTELAVAGRGGVPGSGATAVVLNVTVDHPSEPGVLTVWPSGEGRPLVSNLNWNPGDVVANLVTVKLGANGKVDLWNLKGLTPTIVDVVGYYTPDATAAGRYTPLTPGRVLDTGFDNEIGPGATIDVQVTGTRGVPASGVSGVALNVTVDNPSTSSYFTVWPTGEPRPNASTLNFVAGLTVANQTLAKVGANGRVSIWNYGGSARVVADVVGYFSSQGNRFVPVSPQRLVDTRDGTGMPRAQIGAGQTVDVPIARAGSPVPANAAAAVLNVTSVESSAQSFLTMFPAGAPRPTEASTVNPRAGVPVPNHAYVKLGGGSASLFNFTGSTDVVIDAFGYFSS